MSRDLFAARILRFRELMEEENLDTFLVAAPENRYYLSGYEADDLHLTESSGYLLISGSRKYLLTDFRYQEDARREAPDFELIVYRTGLPDVLSELFTQLQTDRLGVEGYYVTYNKYREIERSLQNARPGAAVVPTDGPAEKMRIIKSSDEIELIRRSLYLTESVLREVWESLEPGKRESDVAWEIERRMREAGAEAVSFAPIVACGPNAALPHAVPTERLIEDGDPVILDMGARLHHYCSDMTRTWIAGTPDKRLQEIYRIVRDAQLAAQSVIRSGIESTEADRTARDLITQAGYGEFFGHGLGHGVGIAVHEKPGLRKANPVVLQENMVVTVEPGIYIPGFGGVRLENMVRITESGCEILNREDLFYSW